MQEFDLNKEEEPAAEEERIRADPDRIDELEMLEDDKLLFGAADKVAYFTQLIFFSHSH